MEVRRAGREDADELARLRWDCSAEDPEAALEDFAAFRGRLRTWWDAAVTAGRWTVWVAEDDCALRGCVWVERVDKVPRPWPAADSYGYVTNVYVEPDLRNQGVGTALLEAAIRQARADGMELLIVWPSERSRSYYGRSGFLPATEPMELDLWSLASHAADEPTLEPLLE